MGSPKKFKTAVLGGTFDHFHKGHKKLIAHGLSVSKRLVIGVTSDEYVKNLKSLHSAGSGQEISNLKNIYQNSRSFESFIVRKKNIEDYLNQNAKNRYKIVKIDDMFGTTLDKNFPANAIVVSKETLKGAQIINMHRQEKNLSPLEIIIQNPVIAQNGGPISSFRIRKGEIDREGKLYIDPDWLSKILYLPAYLRTELKNPLGKLFEKMKTADFKNNFFITVGDETTKTFNKLSRSPNIAVIDYKVARKKKYNKLKELGFSGNQRIYEVKNPPGSLSKELFNLIKNIFENITCQDHIIIQIDGEEDLSVLPLILVAPLGASIFYGQPNKGIVEVRIEEETKAKTRFLLSRFITRGY